MKFEHIGWCRNEKENTDKVWGVILLQEDAPSNKQHWGWGGINKYVTFWGRRGAKLQTKIVEDSSYAVIEMFLKKQNKGYQSIEIDELHKVYPEFQQDLEKTAFWATFKI